MPLLLCRPQIHAMPLFLPGWYCLMSLPPLLPLSAPLLRSPFSFSFRLPFRYYFRCFAFAVDCRHYFDADCYFAITGITPCHDWLFHFIHFLQLIDFSFSFSFHFGFRFYAHPSHRMFLSMIRCHAITDSLPLCRHWYYFSHFFILSTFHFFDIRHCRRFRFRPSFFELSSSQPFISLSLIISSLIPFLSHSIFHYFIFLFSFIDTDYWQPDIRRPLVIIFAISHWHFDILHYAADSWLFRIA